MSLLSVMARAPRPDKTAWHALPGNHGPEQRGPAISASEPAACAPAARPTTDHAETPRFSPCASLRSCALHCPLSALLPQPRPLFAHRLTTPSPFPTPP